jgi:ABC-type phosphate transport system ATPase subunit
MESSKERMMQEAINELMEELIYLDEIAGELDPESNAKIDQRRNEIKAEIKEIQSMTTRWHSVGGALRA